MHNTQKNIIVAIALTLFFAKQVAAQTTVLGVTLGKTTYHEAIAKIPEAVKIKSAARGIAGDYGIMTGGDGYGIAGLKWVSYGFNNKQILQSIMLSFKEKRLDDIKKILASNYKQIPAAYGIMMFKSDKDYITIWRPWNLSFTVEYQTPAYYQETIARIRATKQYKKDLEREVKEEHKRQLAKEAEKL